MAHICYNEKVQENLSEPHPQPTTHHPPAYVAVSSRETLAARIAAQGIVPLRLGQPGPWPTLGEVRAPGVALTEIWRWGGELVAAREAFCGLILAGDDGLAFTTPDVFMAALALTMGSDPKRVYMAGHLSILAKAITDVLLTRGPMRVQQIRQAMRLHKRFLAHDVAPAMIELERALLVVAGGLELAAAFAVPVRPSATPPARPSRWSRQISHDLDLRVWELTGRWAPPEWLAAADRLREHPDTARALLLDAARVAAPAADEATMRGWFDLKAQPAE